MASLEEWMAWVTRRLQDMENPVPPLLSDGNKQWVNLPPPPTIVQDDRYCTYLTANLTTNSDPTGTILNVLSNALFPPGGTQSQFLIGVNQEAMLVSNTLGNSNQLQIVSRSQLGTVASWHPAGSQVFQLLAIQTTLIQGVSAGSSQIQVEDGTQFPTDGNFMVYFDPGTTNQECATITGVTFAPLVGVTVGATITGSGISASTSITGIYGLSITINQPATLTGSATLDVGSASFTGYTIAGSTTVLAGTAPVNAQWQLFSVLANNHSAGAIVTQVLPGIQQQVTRMIFEGNSFVQPGPLPGWVIIREPVQVGSYSSFTPNANGNYNGFIEVWDDASGMLVPTIPCQILPNQ